MRGFLARRRPQDVVVGWRRRSRQRARVLTAVKARRCAPPPLRGADGLDGGSAHALQTGLVRRRNRHDPLHVVVDDLFGMARFSVLVDTSSAAPRCLHGLRAPEPCSPVHALASAPSRTRRAHPPAPAIRRQPHQTARPGTRPSGSPPSSAPGLNRHQWPFPRRGHNGSFCSAISPTGASRDPLRPPRRDAAPACARRSLPHHAAAAGRRVGDVERIVQRGRPAQLSRFSPPMSPSSTTPATPPLLDTLRGFSRLVRRSRAPPSGRPQAAGRRIWSYVSPHSTTQSDPAHRRVNGSSPRRHSRRSQARRQTASKMPMAICATRLANVHAHQRGQPCSTCSFTASMTVANSSASNGCSSRSSVTHSPITIPRLSARPPLLPPRRLRRAASSAGDRGPGPSHLAVRNAGPTGNPDRNHGGACVLAPLS